jgi:hypothetical protein
MSISLSFTLNLIAIWSFWTAVFLDIGQDQKEMKVFIYSSIRNGFSYILMFSDL